jgi:hypothetical protein
LGEENAFTEKFPQTFDAFLFMQILFMQNNFFCGFVFPQDFPTKVKNSTGRVLFSVDKKSGQIPKVGGGNVALKKRVFFFLETRRKKKVNNFSYLIFMIFVLFFHFIIPNHPLLDDDFSVMM